MTFVDRENEKNIPYATLLYPIPIAQVFTSTYIDAKDQSAEFTTYKQTTKQIQVAEKQDIATLFGNVQTKLRTYM